jgi:predicted porin
MKKLLAGMALITVITTAAAEAGKSTVEVYGLIDVGILQASKVGTNNDSVIGALASPMDTSRFGFRGNEPLYGGQKAGFNLEGQINPLTGSQGVSGATGAANNLFSRAANVYFAGDFGRFTLGRQLNAHYVTYNKMDIRGGKNFGSSVIFYSDSSSFGGTSTTKTGLSNLDGGAFTSNSLRYDAPRWRGLQPTLQYNAGAVSGNANASRGMAVSLDYVYKNLNLIGAYYTGSDTTGQENSRFYVMGGNYTMGKTKFASGYTKWQNPSAATGTANTNFDLWSASAGYNLTQQWFISTSYNQLNDRVNSNNGSTIIGLAADYNFSRRTRMYVAVATAMNRGTSGFAPYGGGQANINSLAGTTQGPAVVSVAGQTQNAIVTGMTYRF